MIKNKEIKEYMHKEIEIVYIRRRLKNNTIAHTGILVGSDKNYLCLRKDNGKEIWVKRPAPWDIITVLGVGKDI